MSAAQTELEAAGARVMALHRWVVRLSIDPALVAALQSDAPIPGLDPVDRALLQAVDPRAWGVDVHRRARLVTTVLEECPIIGALLGPEAIDAFLGKPGFVAALESGGSLCVEAARALAPAAGPLGQLELQLCRARRAAPKKGRGVAAAPGVIAFFAPKGSLKAFAAARTRLGDDPLHAIVEGGLRLRAPTLDLGDEALLIQPDAGGQLGVSAVSAALARLISASAEPAPKAAVMARARKLGAGSGAAQLIAQLIEEGLLCEVSQGRP